MRLLYVEDQIESAAIVKEELSEFGFAVAKHSLAGSPGFLLE